MYPNAPGGACAAGDDRGAGRCRLRRGLGSLPAVDDLQRTEAWGSREAAGLRPEPARSLIRPVPVSLSPELVAGSTPTLLTSSGTGSGPGTDP